MAGVCHEVGCFEHYELTPLEGESSRILWARSDVSLMSTFTLTCPPYVNVQSSPAMISSSINQSLSPLQSNLMVVAGRQSAWSKATASLKHLERVEICGRVKRNGHTYYLMQLFFKKSSSNIPTNQQSESGNPPSGSDVTADMVVERRLYEFVNLRHELYYHAHAGQVDRLCAFCRTMSRLMDAGPARPQLRMRLFQAEESTYETFTVFINSVLQLTSSLSKPSARQCDGQREIPLLLQQFMFDIAKDKNELTQQQHRRP